MTAGTRKAFGTLRAALAAALMATATGAAAQSGYAIKRTGEGQQWQQADSISYNVNTDEYTAVKGGVAYKIPRADVAGLQIPKPTDFDKYAQEVASGVPSDTAVRMMEAYVSQCKGLVWDMKAMRLLVPIYVDKKQFNKVKAACEDIKRVGDLTPEIQKAYWDSLLETRALEPLKVDIENAIKRGPRGSAAAAYIVRGDLLMKDGKVSDALVDGYFRAVLMYGDVRDVQPEALYKTWQALKKQNDARAEMFRRKLLEDYPRNRYATMASKDAV